MAYTHGNESGFISDTKAVCAAIEVLRHGLRHEMRASAADIASHMTEKEFYALCTGLHNCNVQNRRLKDIGVRDEHQVFVDLPGFGIDDPYDPTIISDGFRSALADLDVLYS